MDLNIIIQLIFMAGALVGVWVNLNTKITQIDTKQIQHEKELAEAKAAKITLQESMTGQSATLTDIKVSLAIIEMYIELTSKKHEN